MTAKLPPRVTQVVALGSRICGAILSNSTLVALRAAMPAIRASSVSKFCCCDDADPARGGRADLAKISEAEIVGGIVRQGCAAGYALNRMRLSAEENAQDN
jgi:hypothetical protein